MARKNAVKGKKVRITVTADEKAENKVPMLSEIGVYKATDDMALGNGIPEGLEITDDRKFTATGRIRNQETSLSKVQVYGVNLKKKQQLSSKEQRHGL